MQRDFPANNAKSLFEFKIDKIVPVLIRVVQFYHKNSTIWIVLDGHIVTNS